MANENFVKICGQCDGTGLRAGSPCSACDGLGAITQIGETQFTLSRRLDGVGFVLRAFESKIGLLINLGAMVFGLLAAVLFVLQIIKRPFTDLITLEFWRTSSVGVTAFWLALLLACFVVYRGIRLSERIRHLSEKTENVDAHPIEFTSAKKPIDIAESFAPEVEKMLDTALAIARGAKSAKIMPAHLFLAGFATQSGANLMWRLGLAVEAIKPELWALFGPNLPENESEPVYGAEARTVLFESFRLALQEKRPFVSGVEIVLAAVHESKELQEVLFRAGVALEQFENAAAWIRSIRDLQNWKQKFSRAAAERPGGPMNRAMTSIATPLLDAFSDDLTTMAQFGQLAPLVGREREMQGVLNIMESGHQSVVLVGANGVGRDAIVNGLAMRMVLEDVPKILADKRLLALSIPKLVAGAQGSDASEMLIRALNEAGVSGNVILVIPNMDLLSGTGASGALDLLATFASELQKGYLVTIGTTTSESYSKSIERSVLGTLMQKVPVVEMSIDDAIKTLALKVGAFEYQFGTPFSYGALESAVRLTDRYDHDRLLPGKAIEVAREAALAVSKSRGVNAMVLAEDVAKIVSVKANVPVTAVSADESAKLLNLEAEIGKRVIGQKQAVEAVSAALRRARTELRSGKRPIGSFMFLGPTGVGKTELSKAVAEVYFGSEKNMIRLDMSEYQDPGSVNRMLGVPGSGAGGVLTEAMRKNPYTLLLCDELEKAHKDILNLFLQVMDDGRLTDATGRTVDFTSAIVIMTSNAGTQFIQDALAVKKPVDEIKKQLMETELKATYRPEFLNRFDEVVVFTPLSLAESTKIAEIMVLEVANKLEDKGIYFESSEEAIADLARKGYDPLFGARPMRRMIQDTLENAIANLMLKGELARGDKAILEVGGTVTVEKKK
ncbi:MAG: AAA family ATPase [bacterium]